MRTAINRRGRVFFLLKLVIGSALIIVLLSRLDRAELVAALSRYDLPSLLGAALLTLLSFFVASARWKTLVPEVSFTRLFRFSLIGQLYSVLLPGQIAGEAVKAWRISRGATDGPKMVASVMIDRVIGLIALLAVGTVGAFGANDPLSRTVLYPLLAMLVVLLAGLFSLAFPPIYGLHSKILHGVGAKFGRLRGVTVKVLMLVTAWRNYTHSPGRLLLAFALGVVFQLLAVAIYTILASGLGIDLGTRQWMWIAAVTAIAVLLPLSIGGVGLREGALVALLGRFGVSGENAVALSLGLLLMMLMSAFAGWIADATDREG